MLVRDTAAYAFYIPRHRLRRSRGAADRLRRRDRPPHWSVDVRQNDATEDEVGVSCSGSILEIIAAQMPVHHSASTKDLSGIVVMARITAATTKPCPRSEGHGSSTRVSLKTRGRVQASISCGWRGAPGTFSLRQLTTPLALFQTPGFWASQPSYRNRGVR